MTDIKEIVERSRALSSLQLWVFIRNTCVLPLPHTVLGIQRKATFKTSRKAPGIPLCWTSPLLPAPSTVLSKLERISILRFFPKGKEWPHTKFLGTPQELVSVSPVSEQQWGPEYSSSPVAAEGTCSDWNTTVTIARTLAQCQMHRLTPLWEG